MMARSQSPLSPNALFQPGKDICFVAMPYAKKHDHIYKEIIGPAILESGMEPVRSDNILSAAVNINEEMLRIIQLARVVVVDITELNPNVLIEFGVAQAFRKTIVLMTQDHAIPFDLQPLRVLFYDLSKKGKAIIRNNLVTALRSAIYPGELVLREMLGDRSDEPTYIIHGSLSTKHIREVRPKVDEHYMTRLNAISTEVEGVWEIAVAYQKIAWGLGLSSTQIKAADGRRAPKSILHNCNAFILGGPGANPMFRTLVDALKKQYRNCLDIIPEIHSDGTKRYRVHLAENTFPSEQDKMLDDNIDVGMVIRAPSPFSPGNMVWVAAGIRAYGTTAAIKTLVSPILIRMIRKDIKIADPRTAFWAIAAAKFNSSDQNISEISVLASEEMKRA